MFVLLVLHLAQNVVHRVKLVLIVNPDFIWMEINAFNNVLLDSLVIHL